MIFQGRKILIGITGSIAAYKIIYLVRLLVKQGAEVKIVMTPAAADFVSPLVLSTLSKNPVHVGLTNDHSWANHVALGRWADVMLIAPLSCNTLAKMANGNCDNLLLAVYLSATCPVIVAPAMDEDMWKHPATKNNLQRLEAFGHHILSVEKGELASGLFGEGRMAEPETIAAQLIQFFQSSEKEKDFSNCRVLITAGPTYEKMDPVRFIGNFSSGKMGIAIAEEFTARGAEVILVLGPTHLKPSGAIAKVIAVESAEEMYQACINEFPHSDIAVMAAAVADYTPTVKEHQKIKKQEGGMILELTKSKDILAGLGAVKNENQILVGFALETNKEREYALQKLNSKNADLIVMNSLQTKGAGFGTDTNEVTLFFKDGTEKTGALKSKTQVAVDIVNAVKLIQHG